MSLHGAPRRQPAMNGTRPLADAPAASAELLRQVRRGDGAAVIDYLAVSTPTTPRASLLHRDGAAQRRARVRTALTVDMWDALNDTWYRVRATSSAVAVRRRSCREFCDWVQARARAVPRRATEHHAAQRRLLLHASSATFLERADNTARMLDVKYYVLLPPAVDGRRRASTTYQWRRSCARSPRYRAYHWVYSDELQAAGKIADFLILNPAMPALAAALLRRDPAAPRRSSRRPVRQARRMPRASPATCMRGCARRDVEEIFQSGLHEFLTGFHRPKRRLGSDDRRRLLVQRLSDAACTVRSPVTRVSLRQPDTATSSRASG